MALLDALPHLPSVAAAALAALRTAAHASSGCIVLLDDSTHQPALTPDRQQIRAFYSGFSTPIDDDFALMQVEHGIIGYALYQQNSVIVRDLRFDPRYPHQPGSPAQGSAVAVPLRANHSADSVPIGALLLFHPAVDGFSDHNVAFLERVAPSLANALRTAVQMSDVQMTLANANYKRIAAAATEQVQRDLRAMTFHDLRAPLTVIQTSVTAAERLMQSGKIESASEMMRTANQSARQMGRMVKGLLDVERLEEGRAVVNRQPIPLNKLLVEAGDLALPLVRTAEQTLVFDLPAELPPVLIDPDMIVRVIVNLTENATKYSPRGGAITIAARIHANSLGTPEAVVVSVIDQGPGVPPHLRSDVFDKYFRVKHDGVARGVGLGLAFCRLAVEAHGGSIWIDSAEGGGSVFAFTLPVVQQLAIVPAAAAARA
jgi:signal transduction histidine kinase